MNRGNVVMRTVATLFLVFLGSVYCVPAPKDVRCNNQSDCQKVDPQYGYCLQNRCVECLDDPGCGEGNVCRRGQCVGTCWEGRECKRGQVCSEGICTDRQ
jgi:hypothetical protein